jgi:hypothetical protein
LTMLIKSDLRRQAAQGQKLPAYAPTIQWSDWMHKDKKVVVA